MAVSVSILASVFFKKSALFKLQFFLITVTVLYSYRFFKIILSYIIIYCSKLYNFLFSIIFLFLLHKNVQFVRVYVRTHIPVSKLSASKCQQIRSENCNRSGIICVHIKFVFCRQILLTKSNCRFTAETEQNLSNADYGVFLPQSELNCVTDMSRST